MSLTTLAAAQTSIKNPAPPAAIGPTAATRFTAFHVGRSYIFHVKKGASKRPDDCWKEVFAGEPGWNFSRLASYDKPLGETATFSFTAANCCKAQACIDELVGACAASNIAAAALCDKIEITFFTTGVAVLALRFQLDAAGDPLEFIDNLQDHARILKVREVLVKITRYAQDHYLSILSRAENRKKEVCDKEQWTLSKFPELHASQSTHQNSYPIFFVEDQVFSSRVGSILSQSAGSRSKRREQSDQARVSYRKAEIYVDWSEALVRGPVANRELVETNFIIGLASWFALVLMNKNSTLFLFDAFDQMLRKGSRSNAKNVHQTSVAYKQVADASLPIRWTRTRPDLFLLEAIHRNWSSERTMQNVEERMKALQLHHNINEEEQNERANKRLQAVGLMLAVFTLASAVADIINLMGNKDQSKTVLGFALSDIGVYLALTLPALVGFVLAFGLWGWPRVRSWFE